MSEPSAESMARLAARFAARIATLEDEREALREQAVGMAAERRAAIREADSMRARLQAAQEAWAASRFSHASTCLGFIPAQRTPPDWSFSECSCGLSALAAALERKEGE